MSKEIEYGDMYGEGNIICECDNCSEVEYVPFFDNSPSFKEAQEELDGYGWKHSKINGQWRDFCSEKCRRNFIRNHL